MKTKKILFTLMVVGIVFGGCKKDKDDSTPFNASYSDLSDEENKQNLEDNGIAMVNEFDQLKSATAIEIAVNFGDLNNSDFVGESARVDITPMSFLASLRTSDNQGIIDRLKAAAEDPVSLMEFWNSYEAKYTWNFTTEQWDSSGMSDAIVFEFPGKAEDNENTAVLTIDNFSVVTFNELEFDLDEEFEPELPTSLTMELSYNGTIVSSFDFRASYSSKGMPTSAEVTLTVDAFSLSTKVTHSPYSKAGITYSFKENDDILIEMHADASGNWSEENIDDNTTEHTEFDGFDYWTGDSLFYTYSEVAFENIIANANAYIQIMDIKFAGMVNIKSLGTIIRELDDSETITEEEYANQMVEALNKYAKFVVVYADNNEKIAVAEFASVYNEEDDYYELAINLIFSDGSKVDAETYFNDGFDDLIDEMNQFITNVNTEYDAGIDLIEK